MAKLLAKLMEWFSKNFIQKALMGAGLGLASYLTVLVSVRAAFNKLINSVYDLPADMLQLMGIYGIDFVLSAFISVAVFLMTLNSGKLMIRSKK